MEEDRRWKAVLGRFKVEVGEKTGGMESWQVLR